MPNIVRRLRKACKFVGWILSGIMGFAVAITLKHLIDTPQPLESALPGEARLYRWHAYHVFYKVLGTPENPPIVLLHNPGIGASAYEMRHIMAKLAQHYIVYAPDLLGFGLSDRPNIDYTADTYTDLCHDFLTEVVQIAQRPATLLASGISCTYAVEVAHQFPDSCERLVLISPTSLFDNKQVSRAFSSLLRLPIFGLCLYALCSTRSALHWLLAQRNPQHQRKQKGQREQAKAKVEYFYAATHRFGAEHAPLALWSGRLSRDATRPFALLQQPALLIWGTQALRDFSAISDEHQKHHMPQQTRLAIMRDAGIYVHEQYPDVVITDILDWSD
ncbi:MAG TPA: alpha/beta fold hydrolase [Ktedonobacteraceae bacterium]|nr:alpha/beta fold hydrolase [Ktedonobacteraceae bacterium]